MPVKKLKVLSDFFQGQEDEAPMPTCANQGELINFYSEALAPLTTQPYQAWARQKAGAECVFHIRSAC